MPRGVFRPIIRFAQYGCTNRPFFHVVVTDPKGPREGPIFEQVGTFDPLPNKNNEKLVGLNFDRIQHWLVSGAYMSRNVKALLGLSGFLPIAPSSLQHARRKQIAASLRERVAAGETLSDDDIPIVAKYIRHHPLYENVFMTDSFGHESSQIDYNNFETNYRYFGKYTEENKKLTKNIHELDE